MFYISEKQENRSMPGKGVGSMAAQAKGDSLSRRQVLVLVKQAQTWMASSEGKKALQEAAKRGTPVADRLKESRQIDHDSLREPIG
jgi:hypothetical protein